MEILVAFVIGGLYAAGLYMMMRRSILKLVIGLALLSHAANLLIFTMGGLRRAQPPILSGGIAVTVTDPLPQALILTAIVISFGVVVFALVLVHRSVQTVGTDDLDNMKATDT